MSRSSVFAERGFTPFWLGQTLSQLGFQFVGLATPVIAVTLLHATEAELGYLNAAHTAAFLLIGLVAGGLVDRMRKRRVMVAADVMRAAAMTVIPVAFLTGQLAIWQLYLVAAVVGVATVFFDVSYQSYVPILVADEQVASANGALEASGQVARLGGPAFAGALLKFVAAPVLVLATGVGFLVSAVTLLLIRDAEVPRPRAERAPLASEIAAGVRFVAGHAVLRAITATTALSNLGSTLVFTLEPLLVLRVLGVEPAGLGLAMTFGAIGGLLGSLAAPRLGRRLGEGPTLRLAVLLNALVTVLIPGSTLLPRAWGFPAVCAWSFSFGFTVLIYNIIQVTARQRLCPRELLGRMNASIRFVVWGVMPLAALAAGWLGGAVGLVPTLWIGVAVIAASCLPLWLGPVGRLRELAPEAAASEAASSDVAASE